MNKRHLLKTIHDHIAKLIAKHLQQQIADGETSELEGWMSGTVQNMILFERLTNDEALQEELIANDKRDRRIQELVYARLTKIFYQDNLKQS